MENWFIDKLNIHQEHDSSLPIIGSQMVLRVDLQTGHQISEAPKSLKQEGSYSSSLMIRCNGSRVSVQGNPSRWHRSENLFGFTSLDDCIQVYNQILIQHGLPPFTKCTKYDFVQAKDSGKHQVVTDGAIIDHIDITRNFSVGEGNEIKFLRALSSTSWGVGRGIGKNSVPYLYPNCMTVDCHKGSTLQYKKVYTKSYDLKQHKKERLKNATQLEIDYYHEVIKFCDKYGILREEHSFKNRWLKRKKLCFYGVIQLEDFAPYLKSIEEAMKRLEVMNTHYEKISDQLLHKQIVKSTQSANATQSVYLQWLHGMHMDKLKSQYYVHRSRLLQLGIDISIPHDATRTPLLIRSNELIDVKVISPPDWYQLPTVKPVLALAS